jgi:hypothetical protein
MTIRSHGLPLRNSRTPTRHQQATQRTNFCKPADRSSQPSTIWEKVFTATMPEPRPADGSCRVPGMTFRFPTRRDPYFFHAVSALFGIEYTCACCSVASTRSHRRFLSASVPSGCRTKPPSGELQGNYGVFLSPSCSYQSSSIGTRFPSCRAWRCYHIRPPRNSVNSF